MNSSKPEKKDYLNEQYNILRKNESADHKRNDLNHVQLSIDPMPSKKNNHSKSLWL